VDLDAEAAPRTSSEFLTTKLWDKLGTVDEEVLSNAFSNVTDKLEKVKLKTIESKDLTPMISTDSRVVVLPNSLLKNDNLIGLALLRWCKFLKYDIRMFSVEGTTTSDPSNSEQEIGLALWKSLDDITGSVNVQKTKKNVTEEVRAFVRAQQIIGYCSEVKTLGVDILKRSHRYFGNNPSETTEVAVSAKQFRVIKVPYFKRELDEYWRETKWKGHLSQIFITLIRESWRAIDNQIFYKNFTDNLLSLDDFVKVYCATPHEEPVKGQRGKTETHMRVPSKPKENTMLTKAEQTILNKMNAKLFGNTYYEANAPEWVALLIGDGLPETKGYLQSLYKARAAYIRQFAALTTKRLTEIRKYVPDCKLKKKKDVTSKEVTQLLLLREDPLASFVDEVLQMDQGLNSFVGVFVSDSDSYAVNFGNKTEAKEQAREILMEHFRKEELYKDLERNAAQAEAWQRYVEEKSSNYASKKAIMDAYAKTLHENVILGKVPGYKRGGIDDLIRLSRQQKRRTQPKTKKSSGKGKEKESPKGSVEEPDDELKKLAEEAAQEAAARSKRLEDFGKEMAISQEIYDIAYGKWYSNLTEPDDTDPENYKVRNLDPLRRIIQDDRDDILVYIVCLANYIDTCAIRESDNHVTKEAIAQLEVKTPLECAIVSYNETRGHGWPRARFTL
jgi:hypothetical protein